ncbi:MAG: glycosyltransferase family 4 protein [Anaerolineae bacterium]
MKQRFKVTFLTGEYPPMQGGIADHTAYLSKHLALCGIESAVLISRRWQQTQTSKVSKTFEVSVPIFASLPNWGWRCWPGVAGFLTMHRPAVLHIQYQAAAFDLGGWVNWLPWYLKKRGLSTRVVTTFHDLRVPYIFPKAGSFRWRSMLALARYSDVVVCTNGEDWQTLQRALEAGQAKAAPVLTHIPLGSNVEPQPPADFDRIVWRKKYEVDNTTLLLAYFGFLNESKGGEELVEALGLLRQRGLDARLLLIGGEVGHADPTNVAYAQRVQTLIERYNLAKVVYRTGYTDLPEVSANLLAADAVVMPYRDGVSFRRTTLIAALRHGCPVVSTIPADPSTIPEIQPGENMLLAKPHDAGSLAQTIRVLAEDRVLREKLARGAEQLGHLFDWGKIAQAQAEVYHTLAGHQMGGVFLSKKGNVNL